MTRGDGPLTRLFGRLRAVAAPPVPGPIPDLGPAALERARALMGDATTPQALLRAERDVRAALGLHWRGPDQVAVMAAERRALGDLPGWAEVFLFHGDGRLRAAALEVLDGPLTCPAAVFGLAARLNDWADPVQARAEGAFARCWPATPEAVLAPAALALLRGAVNWHRRPGVAERLRDAILDRPTLVRLLAAHVTARPQAGGAQVLRMLAASPALDPMLPDLARAAPAPQVRALALGWLGAGRVWPQGRALTIAPDLAPLLASALADRSGRVRRAALDILTAARDRPALAPLLPAARALAETDPDARVRMRAVYLRKVAPGP